MVRYRTVVAGTDFTELGELAVSAAADVAARVGAERLHLVHVVPEAPVWSVLAPPPMAVAPLAAAWAQSFAQREQRLKDVKPMALGVALTHELRIGSAARELARAASGVHADLVVVASRRRSAVGRAVFGSVASAMLRSAPCPVLVVGADRPGRAPFERVLAAIDTS
ncbi:universal stress protein, partial [Myxococcota bacterium]|nr:universal stress protein [Myxococcota bacterium]